MLSRSWWCLPSSHTDLSGLFAKNKKMQAGKVTFKEPSRLVWKLRKTSVRIKLGLFSSLCYFLFMAEKCVQRTTSLPPSIRVWSPQGRWPRATGEGHTPGAQKRRSLYAHSQIHHICLSISSSPRVSKQTFMVFYVYFLFINTFYVTLLVRGTTRELHSKLISGVELMVPLWWSIH